MLEEKVAPLSALALKKNAKKLFGTKNFSVWHRVFLYKKLYKGEITLKANMIKPLHSMYSKYWSSKHN